MVQDHPRIRGTNQYPYFAEHPEVGSSPHTRDKLLYKDARVDQNRIIPAYAGQIEVFHLNNGNPQDHPRIRGTNED